MTEKAVTK